MRPSSATEHRVPNDVTGVERHCHHFPNVVRRANAFGKRRSGSKVERHLGPSGTDATDSGLRDLAALPQAFELRKELLLFQVLTQLGMCVHERGQRGVHEDIQIDIGGTRSLGQDLFKRGWRLGCRGLRLHDLQQNHCGPVRQVPD